jgi:hypothetical protein
MNSLRRPAVLVPLSLMLGAAFAYFGLQQLLADAQSPALPVYVLGATYFLGGPLVVGLLELAEYYHHRRDLLDW